MPATHLSAKIRVTRDSRRRDSSRLWARSGRNWLICNCPSPATRVTVWWLAMTRSAVWPTHSGTTGLTLPGMIDDPAWRAGRRISPRPVAGPLASRRRSEEILSRLAAKAERMPETSTKGSALAVASTRFSARDSGNPVSTRRCSTARKMNSRGAPRPVPMAVPPRLTCLMRSRHLKMRQRSREMASAKAPNSMPSVSGTASMHSVRPTLTTCAKADSFSWKASWSRAVAASRSLSSSRDATLSAVG